MKIDLNDPRITAFALGELKGQDAIELARAVRVDARVRAAVDAARETSSLLFDTLGDGDTHLLTTAQRNAVRSVAGVSSMSDTFKTSHVAFWKNPAVAGIGVAAVVALTLYIVIGRPAGGGDHGKVADDSNSLWNWSQVKTEDLNAPAAVDRANDGNFKQGGESSPVISATIQAAISEDTTSYRKEVESRISESGLEKVNDLPELADAGWMDVSAGHRIHVPLASGATSWPWLRRYIENEKALPPRQAIRIEEMVNHFHYKTPSMIKERGLAADMELCKTPWNPSSLLLAIHVQAMPAILASEVDTASVTLSVNSDRIKSMRILGYSAIKSSSTEAEHSGQPQESVGMKVSQSRGNYIFYELMPTDDLAADVDSDFPMVTLSLGGDGNLPSGRIASWINASADLRFASTVSATGMLLAGTSSPGELGTERLNSLLNHLEKQDASTLSSDRRDALKMIKQALALYKMSGTNDR